MLAMLRFSFFVSQPWDTAFSGLKMYECHPNDFHDVRWLLTLRLSEKSDSQCIIKHLGMVKSYVGLPSASSLRPRG